MTTPPRYVYLSKHRNYRKSDEWYVVDASDAPLVDFKRIHSGVIDRYGVTRKVLWCVGCQDADNVVLTLNEWLLSQPRQSAGVCPVAFKLNGKEDSGTLLEMAKNFCQVGAYT